jgi:hypothetical protein
MFYRVMRVDTSDGSSIEVFRANDEDGAMYLACGLLQAKPRIPLFWVEAPDGSRVADPKAISDYADRNGYPNLWAGGHRKLSRVMTWAARSKGMSVYSRYGSPSACPSGSSGRAIPPRAVDRMKRAGHGDRA